MYILLDGRDIEMGKNLFCPQVAHSLVVPVKKSVTYSEITDMCRIPEPSPEFPNTRDRVHKGMEA